MDWGMLLFPGPFGFCVRATFMNVDYSTTNSRHLIVILDDTRCGSLCELIWARLGFDRSLFGKSVAKTAIIYGEPETWYFSGLDFELLVAPSIGRFEQD
jgi:hypothetical protein